VRIHTQIESSTLHLAVVGEFDMGEIAYFRKAVSKFSEPWDRVVIELSDVEFMDSSGLQELLDLDDGLRERGGEMVLAHPSVPVLRLFELTGLDAHFNLRD
jgi:anti-sigma B factor antagonist